MTDLPPTDNAEGENDYDATPAFIDLNSAVEVNVPEGDAPMDDDDAPMQDDAHQAQDDNDGNASANSAPIIDQSKATFHSHTDAIYAISSHYDASSHCLTIASGGGDDRAYLHYVTTSNSADNNNASQVTKTVPLSHPHTDSISCVALNLGCKPQVKLVAVGSYDGAIVVYDASNAVEGAAGGLVKNLEGPSDVEWCCFHPKGGSVRDSFCISVCLFFCDGYCMFVLVGWLLSVTIFEIHTHTKRAWNCARAPQ